MKNNIVFFLENYIMASLEWMKQQFDKYFIGPYADCPDETKVKLYQFIYQDLIIEPTSGLEYFLCGEVYLRRDLPDIAQEEYEKSLALGEGRAAEALADYFFADLDDRVAMYRRAIRLGHHQAYKSLAYLYDNEPQREPNGVTHEKSKASIEIFEEAIRNKVPHAHRHLVRYYYDHGEWHEAYKHMERAVAAGCGDQVFPRLIEMSLQDKKKAEYYARWAVRENPEKRYLLSLLALCTSDPEERLTLLHATDDFSTSIKELIEYYRDHDEEKYLYYLSKMSTNSQYGRELFDYYYDKNPVAGLRHFKKDCYRIKMMLDKLQSKDYTPAVRHLLLDLPLQDTYQLLKESFARETLLQLRLDPTYFRYLPLDIIGLIEAELMT